MSEAKEIKTTDKLPETTNDLSETKDTETTNDLSETNELTETKKSKKSNKTKIKFVIKKTFEIDNSIDSKLIQSLIEDNKNNAKPDDIVFNKYLDIFKMIINKKLEYIVPSEDKTKVDKPKLDKKVFDHYNYLFEGLSYFGSDLINELYKRASLEIFENVYRKKMDEVSSSFLSSVKSGNYNESVHSNFEEIVFALTMNEINLNRYTIFDDALYHFYCNIDRHGLEYPEDLVFEIKN